MTRNQLPAERAEWRLDRRIAWVLMVGYPLLYVLGYLSKSVSGSAAIWPAHALAFAAFMLLPLRVWPLVVLGIVSWEVLGRPAPLLEAVQCFAPPSIALRVPLQHIL